MTTLHLIDISSFIHRAWHATPPLVRPSDGAPVGAVYGFCLRFADALQQLGQCTHRIAVMDGGRDTFRREIYLQYKANRTDTPDDLTAQYPMIRDAIRAFGVEIASAKGYEADDVIATYARQGEESWMQVSIVSGDKDMAQLVNDDVSLVNPETFNRSGVSDVREKYGVEPHQLVDVQALAGDTVDNVPGVPGIGMKIAADLIREYGDLEAVLASASEIRQPKRRQNLMTYADQARMSCKLVRLRDDVPGLLPVDAFEAKEFDIEKFFAFNHAMEFRSLPDRLGMRKIAA
jgi:DNA polymerase-1